MPLRKVLCKVKCLLLCRGLLHKMVQSLLVYNMQNGFQLIELQTLIDLLAEETQKYTRAFISGNQKVAGIHRSTIDALVEEINRRKKTVVPGKIESDVKPE